MGSDEKYIVYVWEICKFKFLFIRFLSVLNESKYVSFIIKDSCEICVFKVFFRKYWFEK